MKHLLFFLLAPFALTVSAQTPETPVAKGEYVSYGDPITAEGALTLAEFDKATADVDSLSHEAHYRDH